MKYSERPVVSVFHTEKSSTLQAEINVPPIPLYLTANLYGVAFKKTVNLISIIILSFCKIHFNAALLHFTGVSQEIFTFRLSE
jgi:hypothetical protein